MRSCRYTAPPLTPTVSVVDRTPQLHYITNCTTAKAPFHTPSVPFAERRIITIEQVMQRSETSVVPKKRVEFIDIFRAWGILLMVMGHIGFGSCFDHYIHAFHMPMFYFVSGYFFQDKGMPFGKFFPEKGKISATSILHIWICLSFAGFCENRHVIGTYQIDSVSPFDRKYRRASDCRCIMVSDFDSFYRIAVFNFIPYDKIGKNKKLRSDWYRASWQYLGLYCTVQAAAGIGYRICGHYLLSGRKSVQNL